MNSETMGGAGTGTRGFNVRHDFIENAFERRFQGLLREARRDRSWHVVAAVPGSGKSFGIADLIGQSGACKRPNGETYLPIMAIRAPKAAAASSFICVALCSAFGLVPRMTMAARRVWLVREMVRARVELLIVDDAHDLSLEHLAYLKELTDELAAPPFDRRVGLCLVSASERGRIPLQETFKARTELIWRQFRRRLDPARPYCLVLGHTQEEVWEICAGYEDLYRDRFPELQLVRWSDSIYGWLTHPVLDPEGSGRVTMGHLANLVALSLAIADREVHQDVTAEMLRSAANLMVLRADEVTPVDGEPTLSMVESG